MSLTWAIVTFVIVIVLVLASIMKFKAHPFLALIIGAILMGVLNKVPLLDISTNIATGFGGTLTGVGIIIALGVILGQLLHESGCAHQIATMILKATGQSKAPLAMNLTGIVVSIPVFFDAAFVLLVNLLKSISREGKIPFITLVTALGVGLITTHALVIPTPGPLAVAANMGINLGVFFLYAMIVAVIAAMTGGVLYGNWLGKRPKYANDFANSFDDEMKEEEVHTGEKPSGGLGIALILLPIVMILAGTVGGQFAEKGTAAYNFLNFIGDKNIALLVGVIVAFFALKKYIKLSFSDVVAKACDQTGAILLITGAGGAFGRIINMSAIGTGLKESFGSMAGDASVGIILIIAGFFISQIMRSAQGSATVALVTTSAIMGPIVMGIPGASPVLVAIAICAGGIGGSLPNDSGFWVVSRFSKFSVGDTIRAWTLGGTITGVTALLVTIILSLLSGVLPGI